MKRFYSAALAGILCWIAGCSTPAKVATSQPVGPVPGSQLEASDQGTLQVYSARPVANLNPTQREFFANDYLASNEFPRQPAHTPYAIYTPKGRLFQRVPNASNPDDPQPTLVKLPPGLYEIEAQAKGYDPQPLTVRVPVRIQAGRTTIVHLEGNWHPETAFNENQVVRLPNGEIAGWRSDLTR